MSLLLVTDLHAGFFDRAAACVIHCDDHATVNARLGQVPFVRTPAFDVVRDAPPRCMLYGKIDDGV